MTQEVTTIQLRAGTAAEWDLANPVLHAGEPGLETDTRQIKYGDGVTTWANLDYAAGVLDPAPGTTITTLGDLTDVDTAGAAATMVLTYDGTSWKPAAAAAGGGGTGGGATLNFTGDYDPTAIYQADDLVFFEGSTWRSLEADLTGVAPALPPELTTKGADDVQNATEFKLVGGEFISEPCESADYTTGSPETPSVTSWGNNRTAYWKYTPDQDVTITVDTMLTKDEGDGTDTYLVISTFDGTTFTDITSDDEGGDTRDPVGAPNTSSATAALTAGTTYYFEVSCYSDNMQYVLRAVGAVDDAPIPPPYSPWAVLARAGDQGPSGASAFPDLFRGTFFADNAYKKYETVRHKGDLWMAMKDFPYDPGRGARATEPTVEWNGGDGGLITLAEGTGPVDNPLNVHTMTEQVLGVQITFTPRLVVDSYVGDLELKWFDFWVGEENVTAYVGNVTATLMYSATKLPTENYATVSDPAIAHPSKPGYVQFGFGIAQSIGAPRLMPGVRYLLNIARTDATPLPLLKYLGKGHWNVVANQFDILDPPDVNRAGTWDWIDTVNYDYTFIPFALITDQQAEWQRITKGYDIRDKLKGPYESSKTYYPGDIVNYGLGGLYMQVGDGVNSCTGKTPGTLYPTYQPTYELDAAGTPVVQTPTADATVGVGFRVAVVDVNQETNLQRIDVYCGPGNKAAWTGGKAVLKIFDVAGTTVLAQTSSTQSSGMGDDYVQFYFSSSAYPKIKGAFWVMVFGVSGGIPWGTLPTQIRKVGNGWTAPTYVISGINASFNTAGYASYDNQYMPFQVVAQKPYWKVLSKPIHAAPPGSQYAPVDPNAEPIWIEKGATTHILRVWDGAQWHKFTGDVGP